MRRLVLILCSLVLTAEARSQVAATANSDWTSLFESYVAWDERGGGRPEPWRGAQVPGHAEIEALVNEPPRDPRQAFGFALFLLSHHHDLRAHRLIGRIASRPNAPRRAHAIQGCLLVTRGRYREALAHWDVARDDETCGLMSMSDERTPVRFVKALALHEVGRRDEARRLLTDGGGLGTEAAACLLGDMQERDGNPAAALALWQGGDCQERLAERRAETEPFDVLAAIWGASGAITQASAILAAARLGAIDVARDGLEQLEAQCGRSLSWSLDCPRLPLLKQRLGPLVTAEPTGALRSLAPFTRSGAAAGRLRPYDPAVDDSGSGEDPPAALDGWFVVRSERKGNLVAVVSEGRGGTAGDAPDRSPLYRLHLSRDGGARFEEPIVLGLVPGCPAIVRWQSRAALLSGGNVQLEVLLPRRNGDPEQLEPALLVASLEALTADADGDGLTDALEHAWQLDPSRADSDGDTVSDGSDVSPRVPPGWRRPELDDFLEFLASDDLQGAKGVPAKDLPARASPARASNGAPSRQESMHVLLLRPLAMAGGGNSADVSVAAGPRLIALTRSEAEACGDAAWGPVLGSSRLDVVFDHDGSRALVRLSSSNGGSAWVARRDERWTLHSIAMWVH